MEQQAIETLGALVATVAEQHAVQEAAREAELTAEADLLMRIVELVKPALRAVSNRIETSSDDGHSTFHATRGVSIDNERVGPKRGSRYHDDTRGTFDGSDLFLLTSGAFLKVKYSGSWSNWQRATDSWESTERVMSAREVVAVLDVEDIASMLTAALVRQVNGSSKERTAKSLERAAKLQAIAALLK